MLTLNIIKSTLIESTIADGQIIKCVGTGEKPITKVGKNPTTKPEDRL